MMAYLQLYFGVILLLATTHGQEKGVAAHLGNTTSTSNINETVPTKPETDIKPLASNGSLTAAPEVILPQEGNISVQVKGVLDKSNLPEKDTPGEKDPQIAANQTKDGQGHKTSLIAEPDSIKKDLGGRCSSDKDCLAVNNTFCKDKVCVCNNGFIPSKHSLDKCIKVPSGMFDVCEEESQCSHAITGSECRDGRCQCPPNYFFKHNRCWEKQLLGGICNITEQCEDVPSAVCTQGACDCQAPLIPSPSNKCLEVAGKEYKAACEEDIQCSLSYGDEARCSHGQCRCTNNYHYNGTTCIIDKKLGDPCSADAECEVSEINNEETSRICLENICTCAIGYSSLPGEEICSQSSGNKLTISLFWILCFAVMKVYLE